MRIMTYLQIITFICISILPLFAVQAAAIKCWTNNEGVRECGEVVPPEFAQKGHQELSKQGMVIDQQERAKTDEELAKESKQAEMAAEEKGRLEEQAKEDKILLATFSNVADIELVRNERLQALESSIKVAEKRTETIQQDLDKRIKTAADAERAGNAPNEALLKDIESLRRQINTNNVYIEGKHQEQEETKAEYDAKIARFKELRASK